jgi:hypothetical protein
MASDKYPPYMLATGSLEKILVKVKEARTPERFTQDYLATALGFPGGTPRPFIPLAKRLGLLDSSGVPTELYRQFRNPTSSAVAMASAIRKGYDELYRRNEYVHKLDKKSLGGLVAEATGLEAASSTLKAITGTFETLKRFADFEATPIPGGSSDTPTSTDEPARIPNDTNGRRHVVGSGTGINLSTTIYLNLPNTNDIAVFNAIFRSLRENLMDA